MFTITPTLPFNVGDTLPSTVANTWRTNISRSLDTVNGGVYANNTTIEWSNGSAGWDWKNTTRWLSGGILLLDSGSNFTGASGSAIAIESGCDFVAGRDAYIKWLGTSGHPALADFAGFATAIWRSGTFAEFASGSNASWESGSTLQVDAGVTFTIQPDGELTITATGGHPGKIRWNANSQAIFESGSEAIVQSGGKLDIQGELDVESGATLAVKAGATETNASVLGTQYTGTAPAVTADPGANNIAIGLNQNKGWGALKSDGAGNVTCPKGMNVASVAVSASGAGWAVLFHASRPMDSNDYAITTGYRAISGGPAGAWIPQVELQSSLGFTINLYKADGMSTAADVTTQIHGCGFQIEAKQ